MVGKATVGVKDLAQSAAVRPHLQGILTYSYRVLVLLAQWQPMKCLAS